MLRVYVLPQQNTSARHHTIIQSANGVARVARTYQFEIFAPVKLFVSFVLSLETLSMYEISACGYVKSGCMCFVVYLENPLLVKF